MFNDKFFLTQVVLDGTKTMTRRILKEGTPLGAWKETKKHLPYKVGDVLAIAQSYKSISEELEKKHGKAQAKEWWCNALDSVGGGLDTSAGSKNKMFVRADFMIHHIIITDVKVEHLQDISDEDILKEGVYQFDELFYVSKDIGYAPEVAFPTAREAFWYLIDKISGKGTWESNPWVVAYEFKVID